MHTSVKSVSTISNSVIMPCHGNVAWEHMHKGCRCNIFTTFNIFVVVVTVQTQRLKPTCPQHYTLGGELPKAFMNPELSWVGEDLTWQQVTRC